MFSARTWRRFRPAALAVRIAPISTLLAALPAFGQVSFEGSFAVPTPPLPLGVAMADFTGDGFRDVAMTSSDTDELRILVGNGFGLLLPGPFVNTGSQTNPGDLSAIDIDGDGDLDVAVCLRNAGTIGFFLNDGTGSLAPIATVPTGIDSMGPDVGDLDHDGDMGLVVVNRDDETVSVLRNLGRGTFDVETFTTGPDPRGAAFFDYDNDGDLDVAATSNDDRAVHLFRNDGATYAPLAVLASARSVRPRGIRAGDLNSDGKADLVVASAGGSSSATVFLRGPAGFLPPVSYASGGANAGYLAIDDFECDGDLDLAIVNEGSESVGVLVNDGNGVFGAATLVATGTTPAAITCGDLDGDGDTDLALPNTDADSVTVVLVGCGTGGSGGGPVCGNGICEPNENPNCIDCQGGGGGGGGPVGHFAFDHSTLQVPVPFGALTLDVDLDGDSDLVVASDMPETLRVYWNDGNESFTPGPSYPLPYYSIPGEIVSADFDHDRIADVAVALSGTSGIAVFRGTGAGFALQTTIPTGWQPLGLSTGDADGDGWADLAAASLGAGTVTYARNDEGNWQFATSTLAAGAEPAGTAFVDISGDGFEELAVSSQAIPTVRVYSLASGIALVTEIAVGTVVAPASLRAADLDADGFEDLVAAAHSFGDPENGAIVWLSNGTTIDASTFVDGGGQLPGYVALADLDCDGDLDIALSNADTNDVTILANSGAGVFGPPSSFPVGSAPGPIAAGDVDGDGVADLLATNVNDDTVSILFNRSCGLGPVADLNGDGLVDGGDLGTLLGAWGTAAADITGDGTTDGADLALLLGAWS